MADVESAAAREEESLFIMTPFVPLIASGTLPFPKLNAFLTMGSAAKDDDDEGNEYGILPFVLSVAEVDDIGMFCCCCECDCCCSIQEVEGPKV